MDSLEIKLYVEIFSSILFINHSVRISDTNVQVQFICNMYRTVAHLYAFI